MTDLLERAKSRTWFYRFRLPDGTFTSCKAGDGVEHLHQTRREMMLRTLRARFGEDLRDKEALDLACHEGFFALALAEECRAVRGLDLEARNIGGAKLIAALSGKTISFGVADIIHLKEDTRPADIVLLFGLLYHVEDPLRYLRVAAGLATDTLLIETQVASIEAKGAIEWGGATSYREIRGTFFLVDDQANREGGPTNLALVPSSSALIYALDSMGFQAHVVEPPKEGAEQLVRKQRAIIAAHRRRNVS